MNENLNLVEILKDCPKGVRLYSTIYGDVYFEEISNEHWYRHHPIRITIDTGLRAGVTVQGLHNIDYKGECTLFPSKDQRDWSKWHRPFVDGDIVTYENQIGIFKKYISEDDGLVECYVFLDDDLGMCIDGDYYVEDFATEEEKQLFFNAIREKGYKWNADTKTLEKLIIPKFEVGDVIQDEDGYKVKITEVNVEDECYEYKSIIAKGIGGIAFSEQNDWELIPDKFDPNILIPFESKVLVRNANHFSWKGSIYTHRKVNDFYTVSGTYYRQCIPYNNNTAYLIGTCKEAPKYYKYWED